MMRSLRVSARADAAGWLIIALGVFLPRMALGRMMRLGLPVDSSHRRRLLWLAGFPGIGDWDGVYRRSLIRRKIFHRLLSLMP